MTKAEIVTKVTASMEKNRNNLLCGVAELVQWRKRNGEKKD